MRLFHHLFAGLIGLATTATALDFPATIEVDMVFPQNGTYNNMTRMPVIFAIQNAEAAFDFGYTISWTISGRSIATGTIRENGDRAPPPDAVDNVWIASSTVTNATVLRPGQYTLSWKWSMVTCLESSKRITIQIGGNSASGKISFTVVGDGSGEEVDLTGKCPVFQDRMTADRATSSGCPVMTSKGPDREPDPCKARLDEDMAACVMRNLTGTGDEGACARLRERAGKRSGAVAKLVPGIMVIAAAVMATSFEMF